jgi:hypothetical protein
VHEPVVCRETRPPDRGRDELATPVVDPIACRTMRHAIAGFAASTSIH